MSEAAQAASAAARIAGNGRIPPDHPVDQLKLGKHVFGFALHEVSDCRTSVAAVGSSPDRGSTCRRVAQDRAQMKMDMVEEMLFQRIAVVQAGESRAHLAGDAASNSSLDSVGGDHADGRLNELLAPLPYADSLQVSSSRRVC